MGHRSYTDNWTCTMLWKLWHNFITHFTTPLYQNWKNYNGLLFMKLTFDNCWLPQSSHPWCTSCFQFPSFSLCKNIWRSIIENEIRPMCRNGYIGTHSILCPVKFKCKPAVNHSAYHLETLHCRLGICVSRVIFAGWDQGYCFGPQYSIRRTLYDL